MLFNKVTGSENLKDGENEGIDRPKSSIDTNPRINYEIMQPQQLDFCSTLRQICSAAWEIWRRQQWKATLATGKIAREEERADLGGREGETERGGVVAYKRGGRG